MLKVMYVRYIITFVFYFKFYDGELMEYLHIAYDLILQRDEMVKCIFKKKKYIVRVRFNDLLIVTHNIKKSCMKKSLYISCKL